MGICSIFINMYLIGITIGSSYDEIRQRNWSPLRDGMDVFGYKESCLAQQGKVTRILLYLIIH